VDNRNPDRSLVDDPLFLVSLDLLDHGLDPGEDRPADSEDGRATERAPRVPSSGSATGHFVESVATVVAPDVGTRTATPSGAATPRRRPLLELFPPPPANAASVPAVQPIREPRRLPDLRTTPAPTSDGHAPTYETFYGLHEKPFSLAPDPKFHYGSASHDRVGQDLLSAIGRRDGLVVLTGDLGTGKTTLCRAILEQIDRHTLVSFILDPFLTADDLLKTILIDFGVISAVDRSGGRLASASRSELNSALREFLASLAALRAFAVVIIDDAQHVAVDMLEQLRALLDVENGQSLLLQIVLVGESSLLETLRRPELRPLAERVSVRRRLDPLGPDEILGYVQHRLGVAGSRGRIEFDDGAIARLSELSDGVPRDINRLCDRALQKAYEGSESVIDSGLINTAADDLDLEPIDSGASWLARAVIAVATFVVLMLLGAAGAALVFHDQFATVAVRWRSFPASPVAPVLPFPERLRPSAPPSEAPVPRS
jgi:general secretion pathway protein A